MCQLCVFIWLMDYLKKVASEPVFYKVICCALFVRWLSRLFRWFLMMICYGTTFLKLLLPIFSVWLSKAYKIDNNFQVQRFMTIHLPIHSHFLWVYYHQKWSPCHLQGVLHLLNFAHFFAHFYQHQLTDSYFSYFKKRVLEIVRISVKILPEARIKIQSTIWLHLLLRIFWFVSFCRFRWFGAEEEGLQFFPRPGGNDLAYPSWTVPK